MKIVFLVIFSCFHLLLCSQTKLSGILLDGSNKDPLSFVNIGIKNKNVGTVSSESGKFTVLIPEKNINDTLTFSLVGYHIKTIPVQQMIVQEKIVITLKAKAINLQQVNVTAKKLREVKHGIKKTKPMVHFMDASMNQNDVFEIAQLIKLNGKLSKITSANLLINESRIDSGTFRINFYKYDGNKPAERLVDVNILETHAIKEGWLKFDLKKYNIFLKGNVVLAIEFLPSKHPSVPIKYEVKLGGSYRSFVRTSSLGLWNASPAHYRVFLTALESETERDTTDEEESETVSQARLFSKSVNDTFSLFIHLPKNYSKNKDKKYPVIFLLDANVYFDVVQGEVERLAFKNKTTEPIIIGIGYNNVLKADSLRNRDYTYPATPPIQDFPVSGGAEKFSDFIEKELDVYLTKNYRIDPENRTLMGHSLGGYFTLFVLQKHLENRTRFFKNYISASPSLDYYNSYLPLKFQKMASLPVDSDIARLLITIGSMETEDAKVFNDFTELLSKDFKDINATKFVVPGADHMGAAIPAFEKGLEMILRE